MDNGDEYIGQLICVDITADYITEDDPRFQNWVHLACDYDVGGFVLYGGIIAVVQEGADRSVTLLKNEGVLPLKDTAPFRENDLKFLKELFKAGPNSIVAMSYGNPFLIRKIAEVPSFLVGFAERGWYGNRAAYFDSFIKLLKGDLTPQGKLPVKVNDQYPLGFGLSY